MTSHPPDGDAIDGRTSPNASDTSAHDKSSPEPVASSERRLLSAVRRAMASDFTAEVNVAYNSGDDVEDPLQPGQLEQLLDTVPTVEQAKGLLMGYYGIDAVTAFGVLRRWSSITNTKLVELCAELIRHAAQPQDQNFANLRQFVQSMDRITPPANGATRDKGRKP